MGNFDLFQETAKGSGASLKELAGLDSFEYESFDKVAQKKGLGIYQDLKYDEQVKFCLLIKKFLILSAGWELVPQEGGEVEMEFLSSNFNSLEKTFSNILFQLMSALDYGFSVGELLWKKKDGKIWMKDIRVKFPWDVEFLYDKYGNLSKFMIGNEEMPRKKFVIYSFMEQFGNKSGESDLKAAYNAWWFKGNIWKFWARHLERFGSPIVKGHVPPGATEPETKKFFAIINRLHHIVGMLLPRSKTGEEFDFELVESKREGGQQFVDAIDNADARIARSLLIPQLFGTTKSNFGSYALGLQQFKVVYKFLTFISSNFAEDVVQKQIINPLLSYNFINPKCPTFRFKPMEEEVMTKAIEMAVNEDKSEKKDKVFELSEFKSKTKDLKFCPACGGKIISAVKNVYTCGNGHSFRRKGK